MFYKHNLFRIRLCTCDKELMNTSIKEIVKERYGEAARRLKSDVASSCCGVSTCLGTEIDPVTKDIYDELQRSTCLTRR